MAGPVLLIQLLGAFRCRSRGNRGRDLPAGALRLFARPLSKDSLREAPPKILGYGRHAELTLAGPCTPIVNIMNIKTTRGTFELSRQDLSVFTPPVCIFFLQVSKRSEFERQYLIKDPKGLKDERSDLIMPFGKNEASRW